MLFKLIILNLFKIGVVFIKAELGGRTSEVTRGPEGSDEHFYTCFQQLFEFSEAILRTKLYFEHYRYFLILCSLFWGQNVLFSTSPFCFPYLWPRLPGSNIFYRSVDLPFYRSTYLPIFYFSTDIHRSVLIFSAYFVIYIFYLYST